MPFGRGQKVQAKKGKKKNAPRLPMRRGESASASFEPNNSMNTELLSSGSYVTAKDGKEELGDGKIVGNVDGKVRKRGVLGRRVSLMRRGALIVF